MFFICLITLTALEIESCYDLRTIYRNNDCCSNPYSYINMTISEDIIDTLQLEFYSVNQVATLSELVQEVSDQDYWNSIELDIMNEKDEENSRRKLSKVSNEIVASVQIRTENETQFEKSRNLVICLVKQIKQNITNPLNQCVNRTDVSFEDVISVHSSGHSRKYWKNWRKRFQCDSFNNQTNETNTQNGIQNTTQNQTQVIQSRYGCSQTQRKTCCSWEPLHPWMWWWSRKSCKPRLKYRCVDYTVLFRNETINRCKFVNTY